MTTASADTRPYLWGKTPLVHRARWIGPLGQTEKFKATDFKIWAVAAYLTDVHPGGFTSASDLAVRADVGITSVHQFFRRLDRSGLAVVERDEHQVVVGLTWNETAPGLFTPGEEPRKRAQTRTVDDRPAGVPGARRRAKESAQVRALPCAGARAILLESSKREEEFESSDSIRPLALENPGGIEEPTPVPTPPVEVDRAALEAELAALAPVIADRDIRPANLKARLDAIGRRNEIQAALAPVPAPAPAPLAASPPPLTPRLDHWPVPAPPDLETRLRRVANRAGFADGEVLAGAAMLANALRDPCAIDRYAAILAEVRAGALPVPAVLDAVGKSRGPEVKNRAAVFWWALGKIRGTREKPARVST